MVLACCQLVLMALDFYLCIDALEAVCFSKLLCLCMCKVCVAHQQQAIIAKNHSMLRVFRLLPVDAACMHCISLPHLLFDHVLQHQMHRRDLLVACSPTALFKCTAIFLHVLFVYFMIAACDRSLLLQATSAQNREQSAAQEDRELSSQRAAANGQQPRHADGQAERRASGNEGDEQQAGCCAAGAELRAAWATWQALQELLTVQRYWWKKLHFRYAHQIPRERKRQQTGRLCCNSMQGILCCIPASSTCSIMLACTRYP